MVKGILLSIRLFKKPKGYKNIHYSNWKYDSTNIWTSQLGSYISELCFILIQILSMKTAWHGRTSVCRYNRSFEECSRSKPASHRQNLHCHPRQRRGFKLRTEFKADMTLLRTDMRTEAQWLRRENELLAPSPISSRF